MFNIFVRILDNPTEVEVQTEEQNQTIPSEFVYLNHDELPKEEIVHQDVNHNEDSSEIMNGLDAEQRPQNGAEAYENLVKSLEEDCESDFMVKDIADDPQIDENFGLMVDGNLIDFGNFNREGLFQ